MASSALCLHAGAVEVSRNQLEDIPIPERTATFFPVAHTDFLECVTQALRGANFQIRASKLAVMRDGSRFFGTLDLSTPVADGVSLSVGIRNSMDKSLPMGFCAGSRVFVCDNLAFRSDLLVKRKHTRFGSVRFHEAISQAVTALAQFKDSEADRIQQYKQLDINDVTAESLMLRAFEQGIISNRLLPSCIREWRQPSFEDFQPRTMWSLENAFTTVLTDQRLKSNPQQFAGLSMRLQSLLAETVRPAEVVLGAAT